jgi:hypothetical protein
MRMKNVTARMITELAPQSGKDGNGLAPAFPNAQQEALM